MERALIESLSVQYDNDQYPDRAIRDEKHIEATRSVLDQYPDDLEAGFMYADAVMIREAWNYWERDGSARLNLATLERFISVSICSRVRPSPNELCRKPIG